jgi:hypothetical protein
MVEHMDFESILLRKKQQSTCCSTGTNAMTTLRSAWIRQDFVKPEKLTSAFPQSTLLMKVLSKYFYSLHVNITEQLQRKTNSTYILKVETYLTESTL